MSEEAGKVMQGDLPRFDPIPVSRDAVVVFSAATRILWAAIQDAGRCDRTECVDFDSPHCHCNEAFRAAIDIAINQRKPTTPDLNAAFTDGDEQGVG